MLVRKYQKKVYWHIRKMVIDHDDTDDLTQEVFIKIHKNIETFRQDSQLYTWIYRIATNECLNFLKRKKRRFFLPIGDIENADYLVEDLNEIENEVFDLDLVELQDEEDLNML